MYHLANRRPRLSGASHSFPYVCSAAGYVNSDMRKPLDLYPMNKADQDLPEHFYMAPSSANRWSRCPGSLRHQHEEDIEKSVQFAADRGTLGHLFVAQFLTGEKPAAGWMQFWKDEFDAEAKEDLVSAVAMCIEFLLLLKEEGFELVSEIKLQDDLIGEHGGTIDVIAVHHERKIVHVVDFKFGQIGVDIGDNRQIQCYLLLTQQWIDVSDEWDFVGTIIQPATGGVMSARFTNQQLDDFARIVLWASMSDEYHAGTHCDYCPIVHKCTTLGSWIKKQCEDEFPDLTGFATGLECELPDEHEAATLVAMYKTAKIAEKICNKAGALIKLYSARGQKFQGAGVRKKTYMYWATDYSASAIAKEYALTDEQYLIPSQPLSPSAMAGLLNMSSKDFREKHANVLTVREQQSVHVGRVGIQDFPEFEDLTEATA